MMFRLFICALIWVKLVKCIHASDQKLYDEIRVFFFFWVKSVWYLEEKFTNWCWSDVLEFNVWKWYLSVKDILSVKDMEYYNGQMYIIHFLNKRQKLLFLGSFLWIYQPHCLLSWIRCCRVRKILETVAGPCIRWEGDLLRLDWGRYIDLNLLSKRNRIKNEKY